MFFFLSTDPFFYHDAENWRLIILDSNEVEIYFDLHLSYLLYETGKDIPVM